MLYTIISEYDVFTQDEKPSRYMDISWGKVEYTVFGKNKVIKSLFSTNPRMYLDERYLPGKRLPYQGELSAKLTERCASLKGEHLDSKYVYRRKDLSICRFYQQSGRELFRG